MLVSYFLTLRKSGKYMTTTKSNWDVHKFGGTSVGSADCMRQCIEIIRPLLNDRRIAMVVSAMGGKPKVTDLLLDSVHAAAAGNLKESKLKLAGIREKHQICIGDLLGARPEVAQVILEKIDSDLRDIQDLLRAVALMRTPHEQILELVSGYGEIWSATVLGKLNLTSYCIIPIIHIKYLLYFISCGSARIWSSFCVSKRP